MIGIEEVDAQELRKVLSVLKKIDPESTKALRKGLKNKLIPLAQQVAGNVPVQPPLSGFANNGPTAWPQSVVGKVAFTPGKSRTGAKSLVSIRVDAGKQRGFYIAELAGSRSAGLTNSGRALIEQLNTRSPMKGKGGRYAYKQFRLIRPDAVRIATDILNDTFRELERMLD